MMMELQQSRTENSSAMTFDEVSMERSKSFVKALQELKNLRPQLYSAAEYCEKSYLNSEQKQMVLDNLKDYAVRALVNAVDHLGTVAYKLTDVIEQQTADVSTTDLKVSSLNQQLLTCRTYMEKEGLRQQKLLAIIPRHHKHYMLPNTVNKKVHFGPHIQSNVSQNIQGRLRFQPSATPAAKTLSWHLASETKFTSKRSSQSLMSSTNDQKKPGISPGVFQLSVAEENVRTKPSTRHQLSSGVSTSSGAMQRDHLEGTRPLTAFRSFENPTRREKVHAPVRSKSVLSSFFVKQKTQKLKTSPVS